MSTERLIASNLCLGKSDLEAFRLLLDSSNRNAVYHAEQAVEHIILALAQSEGIHYPRNQQHQLDTMTRALPEDNSLRSEVMELCWLEAYATAYRYPRTKGSIVEAPPRSKLEPALEQIGSVLKKAAEHFGVDLDAPEAPADHARPPRTSGPSQGLK